MFAGTVVLLAAIDEDASAEIVTLPLLLLGLGIGALASQLGAVTVSAVPDEQSPEVGGLQNTATNIGASLGTALAGSILIAILTATLVAGIQQNPAVPDEVGQRADVQLSSGVPFLSDADLEAALEEAGVTGATAAAIIDENAKARLPRVAGGARRHRARRRGGTALLRPDPDAPAGVAGGRRPRAAGRRSRAVLRGGAQSRCAARTARAWVASIHISHRPDADWRSSWKRYGRRPPNSV